MYDERQRLGTILEIITTYTDSPVCRNLFKSLLITGLLIRGFPNNMGGGDTGPGYVSSFALPRCCDGEPKGELILIV